MSIPELGAVEQEELLREIANLADALSAEMPAMSIEEVISTISYELRVPTLDVRIGVSRSQAFARN